MQRHRSIDFGTSERELSTVAPVVVKPLMVSKKASVMLRWVWHIRKGSIPNIDSIIQVKPVRQIASRLPISRLRGLIDMSPPPHPAVTPMHMRNCQKLLSP